MQINAKEKLRLSDRISFLVGSGNQQDAETADDNHQAAARGRVTGFFHQSFCGIFL